MATNTTKEKILYKALSYRLQGLFFDIRNDLGSGHKESIYQNALEKELTGARIRFIKEPSIKVYSKKGEFLGLYRPDFLIEDKIIVELKAAEHISRQETARVYDYLRNSKYELAYFVNFASLRLFIKRLIFTNDRKPGFKSILKSLVVLFVAISFLFVAIRGVNAAELYLETSENQYYINETFVVDIRVNVKHGESINAIEAYLEFPNDILKVKDFSTGNSILTFVEEPKINQKQGLISFIGIIPGGYSGIIPGDFGKSNLLGKIIFYADSFGLAKVIFKDNSQVLLSDGMGTIAELSTTGVVVNIKEVQFLKEVGLLKDEWQEELEKDKIPPEDFKPEIVKINGKYYLTFTTKDKNSGVDHCDVLEKFSILSLRIARWVKSDSPYLLKDQSLSSVIEIRAVDKAGNERIVKLPATYSLPWYKNYFIWVIIILVISLVITKNLWKKLLIHK